MDNSSSQNTVSTYSVVSTLGAKVIELVEAWGKAWIFLSRVIGQTIVPPYRPQLLYNQLYSYQYYHYYKEIKA